MYKLTRCVRHWHSGVWIYLFPQCWRCEKINISIMLMDYVRVRSNA